MLKGERMNNRVTILLCCMVCCFSICLSGMHTTGQRCNERDSGGLEEFRCDAHGYYFDRGGKRMFETSYNKYERGAFNLRRGRLWQGKVCKRHSCKKAVKQQCTTTQAAASRPSDTVWHQHYTAQQGGTQWPSASGPHNARSGTSSFPYVATPIWLRDTVDASGYSTPTSWQGFQ
jgi:hypothetical protein